MTKRFIASTDRPNEQTESAWWFIFSKRRLLVTSDGQEAKIPLLSGPEALGFQPIEDTYLGTLMENPVLPLSFLILMQPLLIWLFRICSSSIDG